jgi:hypothetical protein
MDQDRRDAAAWAKEWQIKQKNRRLLMVLGGIALIAVMIWAVRFAIIHIERTTFGSVEEMRAAMQGRYAIERDYEDIYIEGDTITLTYLSYSHYDRRYAEEYGYNYDEEDSVYEDDVAEWDYRHGVIKTRWMGDIIVDKNGNIRRGDYSYSTFYRTDKPRPEPIDPSTLENKESDAEETPDPEEQEKLETRIEELESVQAAASEAEAEASEGE